VYVKKQLQDALPISTPHDIVQYACTYLKVLQNAFTGTGKTVYVKKQLQDGLPPHMTSMFMTFSAQTSATMTQVRFGCGIEKQPDVCADFQTKLRHTCSVLLPLLLPGLPLKRRKHPYPA
jgi:hypothetical protein